MFYCRQSIQKGQAGEEACEKLERNDAELRPILASRTQDFIAEYRYRLCGEMEIAQDP